MYRKNWTQSSFMVCLVIGVPCAHASESTSSDVATVEQVTARAIEMYQQANSLYLNQQFAEAYELYKAAWALRPNYKVAGNLGNCEYDLRKYRDAAEHLAFALRENPEPGIAATRTYFAERLADATRYVGTVEVSVDNAAIADLFVDNEYMGKVPRGHPIYVNPGPHVIFARNNTASDSVRIEIKKGERRSVALHILPPPPKVVPQVESIPLSNDYYPLGTGVSLALISGGIYMAVAEPDNQSEPPKLAYLWGPMIGGGVVGLISLGILFGKTRTKEAPVKVSGTILPLRTNWYVGLRANF